MRTTIGRLEVALSMEEMLELNECGVVFSEAFGRVEILSPSDNGGLEVSGNEFLEAALSMGFRPVLIDTYENETGKGTIWRVTEDLAYVSSGSWWPILPGTNGSRLKILLEMSEDQLLRLQRECEDI